MRILAVIPARGGSKRIPGKNIRFLGGKPLLVWSIEVVQGVPEICDTLISTDSPMIAEVARDAGGLVPWLRPDRLASDEASSVDTCIHALDWYESERGNVDGLLLLQPTSPFRSRDTVMRGIDQFRFHHKRPVIGVSLAQSHPMWCFTIEGISMRPFIEGDELKIRSQDLPPVYEINGAFYLLKPEDLRNSKSFLSDDMVPLMMNMPEESIDIDTEWDWRMAQLALDTGTGS